MSHRTATHRAALAALALTLCLPALAQAQGDAEERAGESYQIAVDLLNEGRYAESVDAFTRAIELSPDPVFYCNRSAALVRLREYERAIEDLVICRDELADAPEITARADAQLKALSVYTRSVRGRALGVARDIAAGPIVKKTGPIVPPEDVAPVARPTSALAVMGGVGLGLGGASLALAAGIDILSEDVVAQYKAASTTSDRAEYERLRGEVEWRQQAFYGGVIAGGALVGIGAALLIVDALGGQDEAKPTTLRVGPGSIQVKF